MNNGTIGEAVLVILAAAILAVPLTYVIDKVETLLPHDVRVYRDTETGCEYVGSYRKRAALTPRLGADGRPMCGVEVTK